VKLTDQLKIIDMFTGQIVKVSRCHTINMALIEMQMMGVISPSQVNTIGERLDKMYLEHGGI
jgi:hypothetical protein